MHYDGDEGGLCYDFLPHTQLTANGRHLRLKGTGGVADILLLPVMQAVLAIQQQHFRLPSAMPSVLISSTLG